MSLPSTPSLFSDEGEPQELKYGPDWRVVWFPRKWMLEATYLKSPGTIRVMEKSLAEAKKTLSRMVESLEYL